MEKIKLVQPQKEHEAAIQKYVEEHFRLEKIHYMVRHC